PRQLSRRRQAHLCTNLVRRVMSLRPNTLNPALRLNFDAIDTLLLIVVDIWLAVPLFVWRKTSLDTDVPNSD
ncbi:hypothetical protein, partial [uncultured Croceicoccus sp.]|uniref:hypothetical protein n=1 Tax=uncultured Croceicoccus sp. TaxID=1295329 RepID=UPI00263417EB